jgi:outer membrane protein
MTDDGKGAGVGRRAVSGVLAAAVIAASGGGALAAQVAGDRGAPAVTEAGDPLGAVAAAALRANLKLKQERVLESRADADVREARGRFLPSVAVNARYTQQSGTLDLGDLVNPVYATLNEVTGQDRFPTDLSLTLPLRHESRVGLVQPVFNEAIRAGYDASRHAAEAQHAQVLATARALVAQAESAFLAVGAARSLRRIWESTVPLVAESERVAQRRVDAGTATPDAVFRARAERSDVEQRLLEAREQEDGAVRAFNRLLDRPLDTPVDTVPQAALLLSMDLTEDQAVAHALAGREELSSVGEAIEASRAGERAATAAFLPSVAVAVDYGFQGGAVRFTRQDDFWTASVVVSWNVFNGGQDAARRDAARADVHRLRLQRADVEEQVRLDARQTWEAAFVAHDAIATADSRLASAQRTFDLVRRRYEEGLAAPIEFLDARTALTSAQLNRVVTVYRYAMRWVDLERAAALRDVEAMEDQR